MSEDWGARDPHGHGVASGQNRIKSGAKTLATIAEEYEKWGGLHRSQCKASAFVQLYNTSWKKLR
jgi:hypothetical protein